MAHSYCYELLAPSVVYVLDMVLACLQVITNCSFWVLLLVWGISAGMISSLLTLLAQFLCPRGYSDVSGTTVVS